MFMHLRKDLDADSLDWRECQDKFDASDQARPAARHGVNTSYVLSKDIQRLLSGLRTDLDSFTELEAFALMASGYHQTDVELPRLPGTAGLKPVAKAWDFLKVMPVLVPGKGYDDVTRYLGIGSQIGGKGVAAGSRADGVRHAAARRRDGSRALVVLDPSRDDAAHRRIVVHAGGWRRAERTAAACHAARPLQEDRS